MDFSFTLCFTIAGKFLWFCFRHETDAFILRLRGWSSFNGLFVCLTTIKSALSSAAPPGSYRLHPPQRMGFALGLISPSLAFSFCARLIFCHEIPPSPLILLQQDFYFRGCLSRLSAHGPLHPLWLTHVWVSVFKSKDDTYLCTVKWERWRWRFCGRTSPSFRAGSSCWAGLPTLRRTTHLVLPACLSHGSTLWLRA